MSYFAAYDAMRSDRHQPLVFCPKPRRVSLLSSAGDSDDSKAGAELLELFLSKGGEQNQMASSPPFFIGSPPTRSDNPLVHDARFREAKPIFQVQTGPIQPQLAGSPVSPSRKGCGPTKFGFKPAPVRVEGFDCLDRRDHSSRSITAVA